MARRIKWIKSLKHSIIFVYHRKKLSAETLEEGLNGGVQMSVVG